MKLSESGRRDLAFTALGVVLLMVPVVLAVAYRTAFYDLRQHWLQIIAALGGALVGASLPGLLEIRAAWLGNSVRAGGALGLLVLFYLVQPAELPTGELFIDQHERSRPERRVASKSGTLASPPSPDGYHEEQHCLYANEGWELVPASAGVRTDPVGVERFGSALTESTADQICWRLWISLNKHRPAEPVTWTLSADAIRKPHKSLQPTGSTNG